MNYEYEQLKENVKKCVKSAMIPPKYEPYKWSGKKFNCYMYALEACMDFSECLYESECVIAPGFLSRGEKNDNRDTEEVTIQYLKEDCKILNLNISETTLDEKVSENEYKIAVYIQEYFDYHFIRQDSNGKWSEKAGWGGDIKIISRKDIAKETYGEYTFIGMFKISKKPE